MRKLFTLSMIALIVLSCKKDKPQPIEETPCGLTVIPYHTYDTIYPSEYIMYYPGSWWEYSDSTIISCTSWDPVAIRYDLNESNGCRTVVEDIRILPATTGTSYLNYDRAVWNYDHYDTTLLPKIIDTVIGQICYYEYYLNHTSWEYRTFTVKVENRYDSLLINGVYYQDVIQTRSDYTSYIPEFGGGPSSWYEGFYAKDVGLIKVRSQWASGPIFEKYLINHYIAPH